MDTKYDDPCSFCDNGEGAEGEACVVCKGYGSILTDEGHALIQFLSRRGFAIPMSPQAEEELRGMIE